MKGQLIIMGAIVLSLTAVALSLNQDKSKQNHVEFENFGNEISKMINSLILENKSLEDSKLYLLAYFDLQKELANLAGYNFKGYSFLGNNRKAIFLNMYFNLSEIVIKINNLEVYSGNLDYGNFVEKDFNFSIGDVVEIYFKGDEEVSRTFEVKKENFHFTEIFVDNGKTISRIFFK